MIRIINAGPLTTIQDLGRYHYQSLGVSPSGAMDKLALSIGNLLNGNDENATGLEITFAGFSCQFTTDTTIALTGADLDYTLNDYKVPLNQTLFINQGDILKTRQCLNGCRGYLTVLNGLDVAPLLGSNATDLRIKWQGQHGKTLKSGDVLAIKKGENALQKTRTLPKEIAQMIYNKRKIAVIDGPEVNRFESSALDLFYNHAYTISNQSNRMGYRLEGVKLTHKDNADILSSAVDLGTIQVPGSGQPIIAMADRQTTGGYTRIGQVATADYSLLAQMTAGETIDFCRQDVEEARQRLIALYRQIDDYKKSLDRLRRSKVAAKRFNVYVNGRYYQTSITPR